VADEQMKFDVVIVGGGLAGLSAAIKLAEAKFEVLVIERGEYSGAKNVMGGVLYRSPTEQIIPEFWKTAPLERNITETRVWMLTEKAATTFGYKNNDSTNNSFTVLRAKFDQWLAGIAEKKGATVLTGNTVLDVIRSNEGKIIGVKTDAPDGDVYADVVIAADGVNSMLSKKIGLHKEIKKDQVALAVKEVITLPQKVIEDRFNLTGNNGATIEFMGAISKGMVGVGFIYTNKDSLSLGMGCLASDFAKFKIKPYELLEEIKEHPAIAPLIEGGEVKEYMAHLIPEGGYKSIPPLVTDGMLVCGDAAMLVNGIHREGSNMAMISGKLAAETIIRAREYKEYSLRTLSYYKQLLSESFVFSDLKKYKDTMSYMEHNRQFMNIYPEIISDAMNEMITVDGVTKRQKEWKILFNTLSKRNPFGLLKDAFGIGRRMI